MKRVPRPSPATALAALALFISLGGVSYGVAAKQITSGQIQNNTIQSRDVRDGALQGRDVAEINEPQLDIQVLGGIDAKRYVRRVSRVQTETASDANPVKSAPPARCPARKRIIGGGARVVAAAPVPVALTANGPSGKSWLAAAYATTAGAGNWQLVNVAICG